MKNIISIFCSMIFTFSLHAQCEFIDMSVSSSTETQIQLFTPSPFFIPNASSNMHFWDISDSNGNTITQENTPSDGNLFLFQHSVALTDTVIACLTITNEIAGPGISCIICDSLIWQGSIINWAFLNDGSTGTFEATQPPIPNYFIAGQSAPCPPRVINFQNFTFGSDSISWTFPGGDPAFSNSNEQLVTYDSAGDYSFTIEVFNEAGSAAFTSTDEITVFPFPTADYNFSMEDLTVTFENLSEADLNPGQTIDYLWDFGDNSTSTEENPTHVYEEEGFYNVTLSVTNQCGTAETFGEVALITSGLEEAGLFTSVLVTPNPNAGQFEIIMNAAENTLTHLTLRNAIGQVVWSNSDLFPKGEHRVALDFKNRSSGVYFLEVKSNEISNSFKVIMQ